MATWEGVSEFVAVAQLSSFSQAAVRLDTSVAQVSRKVNFLEQRLGVKLLNRTTRKVTLTEAGLLYFNKCKHLVDELALAELAVTHMQQQPSGHLKITAPVTYGEKHLAPVLNDFLVDYPQIELELILTNQRLDLIELGIDLAIRLGQLRDSSLIAKRLATRQLYVCASPEYLSNHGEPHTLSELPHHQCMQGTIDAWRFLDNNQETTIRIEGRMRCNSGFALRDAALKGLGIVQLPDYYIQEDLEQLRLIEILKPYRAQREGIWALYPKNRFLPAKVQLVIKYLAERLQTSK
ncbi:Transcriptional regulator, LysR family, in formaldehyde detoxification operon [Pseudoalteromonas luteoviolacea B = ATCC 29581]|nr:Transcriptional regulator, LysR family, in formaldehyde detoxification operon [Pseudoalteromonas luteoviolacea B = ATCC 29581]